MQRVGTVLLVLAVVLSSAVHVSASSKTCGALPQILYGTFPKSCREAVPGTICAALCDSG